LTLILADTSIWIDHFRVRDPMLDQLLGERRIRMHPFVIGELAMGNLRDRSTTLEELQDIHHVVAASDDEVMRLVEAGPHHGAGLGWVDAHLLAAVVLADGLTLWTRDRRLNAAAGLHGVAAVLHH
jgi:predicted nucleic acid-binding protein